MPNARVDAVVNALHVYAKEPVKILLRRALHRAYMRNSRVVHQDLDAFFRKELLEHFPDVPLIGDVARMRRPLPARIRDLFRRSCSML